MPSISDHDKGKRKLPDETTPLLASSSAAATPLIHDPPPFRSVWSRRLRSRHLIYAALALTATSFLVLLLLAGYTYVEPATHASPDSLINNGGVVFRGPTQLDVVGVHNNAIVLRVGGLVGIDADRILELDRRRGGFLSPLRTALGRWAVGNLLQDLTIKISTISIFAPYSRVIHAVPKDPLLQLSIPPFTVPVSTRRPADDSWLTPITWDIAITPNQEGNALLHYAEDAWKMRRLLVTIETESVSVRSARSGIPCFVKLKSKMQTVFKHELSPAPGVPSNATLADLISLQSYSVHPIPPSSIGINAEASIVNPFPPSIHGTFGQTIPFTVSLLQSDGQPHNDSHVPESSPIARVTTAPISLTHPNITLSLAGTVLPLSPASQPLLSQFLSNYLAGRSSPILISSTQPLSASLRASFPGPTPKPQIIKHVTIRQMKIYPDDNGTALLTSGVIIADISIPPTLRKLNIDVRSLLPDVIVFDGPPPTSEENEELPDNHQLRRWHAELSDDDSHTSPPNVSPPPFPPPPLPSPLPPRAFARIRPPRWLNATSTPPSPGSPEDISQVITAVIKDVPLEVLPGRDEVFSSFVSKVVFKGVAEAGVRGDAAVGVHVEGLSRVDDREMDLKGLPVEGVFLIKRGDVLKLPKITWFSRSIAS